MKENINFLGISLIVISIFIFAVFIVTFLVETWNFLVHNKNHNFKDLIYLINSSIFGLITGIFMIYFSTYIIK